MDTAELEKRGVVGDRYWAVRDDGADEITGVKRIPKLLNCTAVYRQQPRSGQIEADVPDVMISLPNGNTTSSRAKDHGSLLSHYVGKPVSLHPLQAKRNLKFYSLKKPVGEKLMKKRFAAKDKLPSFESISWLKILELAAFATPLGRFYDVYPLHLVSSNSVKKLSQIEPQGDFNARRFRPNLIIKSSKSAANLNEFEWLGGKLYIGDTVLKCESKTVRCSMPAQPRRGMEKDSRVLKTIDQHTDRHMGINISVIKTGEIKIGDEVYWQPSRSNNASDHLRNFGSKIKKHYVWWVLRMIDKLIKN